MATFPDLEPLDLKEQRARLVRTLEETIKSQAETNYLRAQATKAEAEVQFMPRSMIFQAMIATAGLLGAGAAIAKLFFS